MGRKLSAETRIRERPQRGVFRLGRSCCKRCRLNIAGPAEAHDGKTVSLSDTLVKESSVRVSLTQTIGPFPGMWRRAGLSGLENQINQREAKKLRSLFSTRSDNGTIPDCPARGGPARFSPSPAPQHPQSWNRKLPRQGDRVTVELLAS
jgi:hypothetical protein